MRGRSIFMRVAILGHAADLDVPVFFICFSNDVINWMVDQSFVKLYTGLDGESM